MVNDLIILLNRLTISSPLADPRRQRHAALHAVRAAATNLRCRVLADSVEKVRVSAQSNFLRLSTCTAGATIQTRERELTGRILPPRAPMPSTTRPAALSPSHLLCSSLRVAWAVLGCSGEIGQKKGKFFGKAACPRGGLRRAPVTHHNDNKQESCVRQGSCFVIPTGTVCR